MALNELLKRAPTAKKTKAKEYVAPPDHGAIPTGYGVYPDQKDGPTMMGSAQRPLYRESYGPQFHDRTPELLGW